MSYLVLARKFRPQTFNDVIGQGHVTQTLINAISSGRVAHAILFSGPRGTGKTTVARILAKALNCRQGPTPSPCNVCRSCKEITAGTAVDVYEIDGASNNSVDQVRELRDNIKYMPAHSPFKIYIIDEVHMLSTAAFNALLKTLEEPPAHVLFFFATTEPHKIPITILSRCQRHDLRRIDLQCVVNHLKKLCDFEKVAFPEDSLRLIARESGGSMRDALSLLDQMISCADGRIQHEQVLDLLGAVDTRTLFQLSQAVLSQNVPELLDILDDAYGRGRDLKKLYADLVGHFRNLLVIKISKNPTKLVDFSTQEIDFARSQIQTVSHSILAQVLDLLMKEETAIRYSTQPRLSLEMVFIRLGVFKPAMTIEKLIDSLEHLRKDFFTGSDKTVGNPASPHQMGIASFEPLASDKVKDPVNSDCVQERSPKSFDQKQGIPDVSESLDTNWQSILNRISENHPALAASLSSSKAVALSGRKLTIEIAGSEFNVNRVQQDRNKSILAEICGSFFGKPLQIELITQVADNRENQEKKEMGAQLRNAALHHPLVQEVVDIFDGKVLEVKLL